MNTPVPHRGSAAASANTGAVQRLGTTATIVDVLDRSSECRDVVLRPPRAGEYGWVVQQHGALYAEEYDWDQTFEALVARIVADFLDDHDPTREAARIAEVSNEPAGCVFCVRRDDETAQLRLLLVDPHARGTGVGAALVEWCIRFARDAGYRRLVLWTNDVLVDARPVYERAGFRLVDESPHHSFGADLVGQKWALELGAEASPSP